LNGQRLQRAPPRASLGCAGAARQGAPPIRGLNLMRTASRRLQRESLWCRASPRLTTLYPVPCHDHSPASCHERGETDTLTIQWAKGLPEHLLPAKASKQRLKVRRKENRGDESGLAATVRELMHGPNAFPEPWDPDPDPWVLQGERQAEAASGTPHRFCCLPPTVTTVMFP
jgi:hypothetical protein